MDISLQWQWPAVVFNKYKYNGTKDVKWPPVERSFTHVNRKTLYWTWRKWPPLIEHPAEQSSLLLLWIMVQGDLPPPAPLEWARCLTDVTRLTSGRKEYDSSDSKHTDVKLEPEQHDDFLASYTAMTSHIWSWGEMVKICAMSLFAVWAASCVLSK